MKIVYSALALENSLRLEKTVLKRIKEKLSYYAFQQHPKEFAKKLVGTDYFRYRVGKYRVVVEFECDVIFVIQISHRKDIYKKPL